MPWIIHEDDSSFKKNKTKPSQTNIKKYKKIEKRKREKRPNNNNEWSEWPTYDILLQGIKVRHSRAPEQQRT